MTDLLTTKQVQAILHVDRTTIYRMVEGGQLPAIRVGKQWRFARADVEQWLQSGRYGALPSLPAEDKPAASAARRSSGRAGYGDLAPPRCAQSVQDAFADMLGVTMVITDMQGQPVTEISNPCGFFERLMEGNADGLQHCVRTWQQMAGLVALEPKFSLSEMGLMCARGLIRVGAELKGMVVIGGIAPDNWPPDAEQIARAGRDVRRQPRDRLGQLRRGFPDGSRRAGAGAALRPADRRRVRRDDPGSPGNGCSAGEIRLISPTQRGGIVE